MNNLQILINDKLSKTTDTVSILLKDLTNNKIILDINSNTTVISASTIKVPIMLSVLHKLNECSLPLDTVITITDNDVLDDTKVIINNSYTIEELLYWMIINSDNTATNALIRFIGIDYINAYIHNVLHLKSTKLERLMLDFKAIENGKNNYTSEQDLLHVFECLFNKKILNDDLCDIAINILYAQRNKDFILRHVYTPIPFAHKTGDLDYLIHDVGVITINNINYYIGISITDSSYIDGNTMLMGKLGKTIINYLQQNKDED